MARGKRKKLLLALGCAVLAAGLLELAATLYLGERFVRGRHVEDGWMAVGRFDPLYGWSNRPGAHERIAFADIDYEVRIDSAGFRDREREVQKLPGIRRVAVLGDSVTWGWGVDANARFTDLLEERLGPGVEVLNLACPGYGTDQQYWTLVERGLAYEPDMVVLVFVLNDVFEARDTERYGNAKPRYVRDAGGGWVVENRPVPETGEIARGLRAARRELVAHSAVLAWATGRGDPRNLGRTRKARYRAPNEAQLAEVRAASDALSERESVTHALLGMLDTACTERGIRLFATLVPHKHDQYLYEPDFPRPDGLPEEGFRTYTTQRLEEAGAALLFEVVPVDAAMLAATRAGERLHVGDGHLNAAGHAIVADALEPALRAVLEELDRR